MKSGSIAVMAAEIECTVDLDRAQKGVHMSRFPELFDEAIDDVVMREALLVEELAEHIARHVVERQSALSQMNTSSGSMSARLRAVTSTV